jgi:hypothetical protein
VRFKKNAMLSRKGYSVNGLREHASLTRGYKIARNFSGLLPHVHPEKNTGAYVESDWRISRRF